MVLINDNVVSRNDIKDPFSKSSRKEDVEGELFGMRVCVKPNGNVMVLSVS